MDKCLIYLTWCISQFLNLIQYQHLWVLDSVEARSPRLESFSRILWYSLMSLLQCFVYLPVLPCWSSCRKRKYRIGNNIRQRCTAQDNKEIQPLNNKALILCNATQSLSKLNLHKIKKMWNIFFFWTITFSRNDLFSSRGVIACTSLQRKKGFSKIFLENKQLFQLYIFL